ncbi:MAG: hypothetical protein KC912_12025 [Proteobacteria bacterium]|nr:hypothetical protein [Pseudomonadota bacterium]
MQMDLEPRCNFQELAGRWEGEPPSPPSITAWQVLVLDERARDGGVIGYTELWDDGELVCTLDIECIAGEPGHAATRKQDAYAPCREGYYRLMVEHHTLWVDFNGVNEPSGDPYALGCESAHLDH